MVECLALIGLGLVLGMRHSTDPDHVIAISTIVSRQPKLKPAAWVGVLWGVGHTLTILVVGVAIILFRLVIPPRLGLAMEMCVAGMLILLGLMNLTGILGRLTKRFTPSVVVHSHAHDHGEISHAHPHIHLRTDLRHHASGLREDRSQRSLESLGLYHILRPLVVGIVHGLAGSAAVALLVLTTIRNPYWAVAYLLVFGFGTIVGMMLITGALASSFIYAGTRFRALNRHLATASGVVSLGFGLVLAYHIGFGSGLFTLHPHWIPH